MVLGERAITYRGCQPGFRFNEDVGLEEFHILAGYIPVRLAHNGGFIAPGCRVGTNRNNRIASPAPETS